jgi:phosphotriesterase-related protein
MHEHVFSLCGETLSTGWFRDLWDPDEQVENAVRMLNAVKASGIDTFVDCTATGLGRQMALIQRIAARVDLHIVVATGLYAPVALPMSLSLRGPGTLLGGGEPLVDFFLRDLKDGIDGTGVRPAFLKAAFDTPDPDGPLARPLHAIGRVSAETGLPIQVHTDVAGRTGIPALNVLREHGVDLTRVIVGHAGDSDDLDYLQQLLDSGATIGCDRFGLEIFNPTERRIDTVVTLVERGYAGQIVLSHDTACFNDAMPDAASQETFTRMLPEHRFGLIPEVVLPALRQRGVSQEDIDTMTVDNPRRFFGGS